MNSRSTECEAEALTTTPLRRLQSGMSKLLQNFTLSRSLQMTPHIKVAFFNDVNFALLACFSVRFALIAMEFDSRRRSAVGSKKLIFDSCK